MILGGSYMKTKDDLAMEKYKKRYRFLCRWKKSYIDALYEKEVLKNDIQA